MNWASRRRIAYFLGVVLFFSALIGIPLAIYIYEPPSCFDKQMNQGETAPDRGGPCKLLDARRIIPPSILWTRVFSTRPGIYNTVVYIENPNAGAGVKVAHYRIKLYDEKNIFVAEREGVLALMPGTINPVFEGSIETGQRIAVRALFEFTNNLVWERLHDRSIYVAVSDKSLDEEDVAPRLKASVTNTDVASYTDVGLVAVIFDTAGNAFAASSTVIPSMRGGEKKSILFTWPAPFTRRIGRFDVLPIVPPID
ncbi:MAG: hypothetical protein AAB421_05450 [Patescibacteria group bacterium]